MGAVPCRAPGPRRLTKLARRPPLQAEALRVSLDKKGKQAKVYVAMRYWKPFTEDTLEDIKRDR